ncbi:MAG: DNA translocase FtsK [Opitutales bacterium]
MAARKRKGGTAPKVSSGPRRPQARPVLAVILGLVGLMALIALLDFDPAQSPFHTTDAQDPANPHNAIGLAGVYTAFGTLYAVGVAAWLLPFALFWAAGQYLFRRAHRVTVFRVIALLAGIVAASGIAAFLEKNLGWQPEPALFIQGLGGWLGTWLYTRGLVPFIGDIGGLFALILTVVLAALVVGIINIQAIGVRLQTVWHNWLQRRAEAKDARRKKKLKAAEARKLAREEAKKEAAAARKAAKAEAAGLKKENKARKKQEAADAKKRAREAAAGAGAEPESDPVPAREPEAVPVAQSDKEADALYDEFGNRRNVLLQNIGRGRRPAPPEPKSAKKRKAPEPEPEPEAEPEPESEPEPGRDEEAIRIVASEKTEKAEVAMPQRRGDYQFPTLNLLADPVDEENAQGVDHYAIAENLRDTLDQFKVKVSLGEIHTGPVITRYEVSPAPGVRVEKIANLDRNIALALKSEAVRILAPVPGKGVVGVEVPNPKPLPVCLRDIIESKAWAESKAEIPIALGKEVSGKPLVADLTRMPHLLIAGSTGSGKTVCINAVIASLLYHSSPDDLRFIMVDPKIVEMQVYNSLPHMMIPVVTEPKKVPGALKWLLGEMERRYQVFARMGVRNIAGFNGKVAKNREERERARAMEAEMELTPEERAAAAALQVERDDDVAFDLPEKKMPYIVCIVDELADLMMVAPADIETCIARLAQLARAAGIHLIIATQRPSVNVITGVIKANLPTRISFKVSSKVDSRTILDAGGAEALIGKGDLLFTPPGAGTMVRAQGAFVSDEEINSIVDFLKVNGPPDFVEEVQKQIDAGGDGDDDEVPSDLEDDLLPDALEVLRSSKRASTSMLQRRLRIGYNRAARIMEIFEDRGVVGPENGSSPRELLVDVDSYRL